MKVIIKIIKALIPRSIKTWIKQQITLPHLRPVSPYPPPPSIPPENMVHQYTQGGEIDILYRYFDNTRFDDDRIIFTIDSYKQVFSKLKRGTFIYYGKEGKALLLALDKYEIKGKDIIIWGLAGCNCEAIAIWKGAKNVYVVEYNKPVCEYPGIEVFNHEEITKRQVQAHCAISYSTFEHDGLGSYGDPLNPDGDLRAMKEAHKFLYKNGILFLGVPLGIDCVVWNEKHIYGEKRLPLLLKGWKLLDCFDVYHNNDENYPFNLPKGESTQNTLVLQRIEEDFPEDDYLLKVLPNDNEIMRNANIVNQINKMLYKYKQNFFRQNNQ